MNGLQPKLWRNRWTSLMTKDPVTSRLN